MAGVSSRPLSLRANVHGENLALQEEMPIGESNLLPSREAYSFSLFAVAPHVQGVLMNSRKELPIVLKRLFGFESRINHRHKLRQSSRPHMEVLETRLAPAVFDVNTVADTTAVNLNTGLDASGNISLRSALMAANHLGSTNTINLRAGTYKLASGELDINGGPTKDNLTITGAGSDSTIIDAQKLSRVFQVFSGNFASISQITVQNGSDVFGSIYNSFGTLSVTNSTFLGNSGGGIYNSDGTLSVRNSTFSGNSGSAIQNSHGTVTVSSSSLSGNSGSIFGGGIYNGSGTLTVSNSTISGNSAIYGGGIENYGRMTVSNSTITGNSSLSSGGGVDNSSLGMLTVSNCTISGNTAGAFDWGGGISNSGTIEL